MKISRKAWIACAALAAPLALVLTASDVALAQSASSSAAGTPLVQLIEGGVEEDREELHSRSACRGQRRARRHRPVEAHLSPIC